MTRNEEEDREMKDLAQVRGTQLLSNCIFPDEHEPRLKQAVTYSP